MKKFFILLVLIMFGLNMRAQLTQQNSSIRKALVIYHMDSDGFYKREEGVLMNDVDEIQEYYAYDKKGQNLYVLTKNSNCMVTLSNDYAKIIKKNKTIPQLKGVEIEAYIKAKSEKLEAKFQELNEARTKHLQDSIEQARRDSIARAEEMAVKLEMIENYRRTREWFKVPLYKSVYCDLCREKHGSVTVIASGIVNDTLYYNMRENGELGGMYYSPHKSKITKELESNEDYGLHLEAFRDSLYNDESDPEFVTAMFFLTSYQSYQDRIKKIAPYGYFKSFGWDNEYDILSFGFRYCNTNEQTIKYIDVYFTVFNSVGDIRKTGHFKGTGPLKKGESASWDWDSSSYILAGDASRLRITKVILTYMNGSQKVLSGKQIVFQKDYE